MRDEAKFQNTSSNAGPVEDATPALQSSYSIEMSFPRVVRHERHRHKAHDSASSDINRNGITSLIRGKQRCRDQGRRTAGDHGGKLRLVKDAEALGLFLRLETVMFLRSWRTRTS